MGVEPRRPGIRPAGRWRSSPTAWMHVTCTPLLFMAVGRVDEAIFRLRHTTGSLSAQIHFDLRSGAVSAPCDSTRAFASSERSTRRLLAEFIKSDPIFDGLHHATRCADVLRRMNLGERHPLCQDRLPTVVSYACRDRRRLQSSTNAQTSRAWATAQSLGRPGSQVHQIEQWVPPRYTRRLNTCSILG